MKRAILSVSNNTRSKKPRLVTPLCIQKKLRETVSATHTYNYLINDHLIDWLKLRSRRGTRGTPIYTSSRGFSEFIMSRGIEFESKLIQFINNNRVPIVSVSEYITDEGCKKTIELMKQGVPALHSAPVRNHYNSTQGIIDLLIRSDYLDKLVDICPLTAQEMVVPGSKLNGNYHYIVIDIKFSTLPLRADGVHLLNSGHYTAYKAQTLIYTQAIGHIQGFLADYAFIMGRRWRCTSNGNTKRNYTCLNRLGKIDYKGVDSRYKSLTRKAIHWVRDVRRNGQRWSVNPPSRNELYPNMCVDSGMWNSEKKKIAKAIGEITSIWYLGAKHRNIALNQGVSSWHDERCTTDLMNFRGNRAKIVDQIMSINRQDKDKIWPDIIKNNIHDWKTKTNELYVDFETLSDIFSDFSELPNQQRSGMIFMIGLGWEENGCWNYKNYVCSTPTLDEEYRIMNEFAKFIEDRGYPKLYFWCAESNFWKTAEYRQFDRAHAQKNVERCDHISDDWNVGNWKDLSTVFKSEPIVLKNCFKFGLKAIANAMHQHGMIETQIDSRCNSGMMAMINAWDCYKTCTKPESSEVMKDIIHYNEFDCKVLWDILKYLRTNHIN